VLRQAAKEEQRDMQAFSLDSLPSRLWARLNPSSRIGGI
jgi:hypothetical protein